MIFLLLNIFVKANSFYLKKFYKNYLNNTHTLNLKFAIFYQNSCSVKQLIPIFNFNYINAFLEDKDSDSEQEEFLNNKEHQKKLLTKYIKNTDSSKKTKKKEFIKSDYRFKQNLNKKWFIYFNKNSDYSSSKTFKDYFSIFNLYGKRLGAENLSFQVDFKENIELKLLCSDYHIKNNDRTNKYLYTSKTKEVLLNSKSRVSKDHCSYSTERYTQFTNSTWVDNNLSNLEISDFLEKTKKQNIYTDYDISNFIHTVKKNSKNSFTDVKNSYLKLNQKGSISHKVSDYLNVINYIKNMEKGVILTNDAIEDLVKKLKLDRQKRQKFLKHKYLRKQYTTNGTIYVYKNTFIWRIDTRYLTCLELESLWYFYFSVPPDIFYADYTKQKRFLSFNDCELIILMGSSVTSQCTFVLYSNNNDELFKYDD